MCSRQAVAVIWSSCTVTTKLVFAMISLNALLTHHECPFIDLLDHWILHRHMVCYAHRLLRSRAPILWLLFSLFVSVYLIPWHILPHLSFSESLALSYGVISSSVTALLTWIMRCRRICVVLHWHLLDAIASPLYRVGVYCITVSCAPKWRHQFNFSAFVSDCPELGLFLLCSLCS